MLYGSYGMQGAPALQAGPSSWSLKPCGQRLPVVHDREPLPDEAAAHRGSYTACPTSPAAAFTRISTVHF